jgi:putative NADH-flavin reductase
LKSDNPQGVSGPERRMRLLVLGASGGVGRALVNEAARRGHKVTAFVRPATAFEPPAGVRVVRGEILRGTALAEAVGDVDAVLCAVGMKRAHPANPWSRNTSPENLTSAMAQRVVEGMRASGVRRVIAVSAAGVGDSGATMNVAMRLLLATTMIGTAYRDLEAMEQVFSASGLDWLAPRPTRLTHGAATGRVRVVSSFGSLSAISRADVAGWMLDALEQPVWPAAQWHSRTPQISRG